MKTVLNIYLKKTTSGQRPEVVFLENDFIIATKAISDHIILRTAG